MKNGILSSDLRHKICSAIRHALSPRHVPAEVIQVRDIPYTVNGKRIENLVRDIVCGRTPKVSGTAANPECLAEYAQFADLGDSKAVAKL
jgi:acetoacetyl-CoA synthetase